mgnify:FL=1
MWKKLWINTKKIIDGAIIEINKQLPKESNIKNDTNFEILGSYSNFDSMALINFILFIEEKIKVDYKKNLNLLDTVLFDIGFEGKYQLSDLYKDIDDKINKSWKKR